MSTGAESFDEFVDRQQLFDLVRLERWARDQRRFDIMADCFHQNAWVRTSWYNGRGGQAYVDATRESMGDSITTTYSGKHWVFPGYAKVVGDRAIVESPAKIFSRWDFDGADVAIHQYCRLYSRAIRVNGRWKLLTFHVLWEWDELRMAVAGEQPPVIDYDLLNSMRPSYRFLCYTLAKRGLPVNHELLGDDRWDELVAFHEAEARWLDGAGAIDDPA